MYNSNLIKEILQINFRHLNDNKTYHFKIKFNHQSEKKYKKKEIRILNILKINKFHMILHI